MEFGENLQKLRKRKNISQEQLAEELGVTRQSVSKWESNQSIPDMEKLATVCKIFNCDLDTLVNGDVEQKKENTSKNAFLVTMESIGNYLEKTIRLFERKTVSEIVRIVVQILLIIFIVALFKIPFEMIEEAVTGVFHSPGNRLADFFGSLWVFIVNLIYTVLAIGAFFWVFKIKFLDEIENSGTKERNTDFSEGKNGIENEENHREARQQKIKTTKLYGNNNTFLDFITSILIGIVKFWAIMFLLPTTIATISVIVIITLLVSLIFEGIVLIGPILCCLASIIIGIVIIELVFCFIVNAKAKAKRLLISIITSFIVGGVGVALTILFIMNLTIINEKSMNYKKATIEEIVPVTEILRFEQYYAYIGNSEKIEDETMGDKFKIEVIYYNEFIDAKIVVIDDQTFIDIGKTKSVNLKAIFDSFIGNLKENKIYNYANLNNIEIKITGTKANLDKLILSEDINQEYYGDQYYLIP